MSSTQSKHISVPVFLHKTQNRCRFIIFAPAKSSKNQTKNKTTSRACLILVVMVVVAVLAGVLHDFSQHRANGRIRVIVRRVVPHI